VWSFSPAGPFIDFSFIHFFFFFFLQFVIFPPYRSKSTSIVTSGKEKGSGKNLNKPFLPSYREICKKRLSFNKNFMHVNCE
jgi:hypothetical protein